MLAEALMRQALFAESRGVPLLTAFHGRYAACFASTPLEQQLRAQIADESRHARAYARLLAKRTGAPVGRDGVDAGWQTIIRHIGAASSFSTTLVGTYGLVEPFNLLTMNAVLLPLLDRTELAEVEQIARDEARHVGMFELFAELVESGAMPVDQSECLTMIRVFLEAVRDGVGLSTGERITLPRSEWKAFMRHVAQLKDRILGWSGAAPSCSSQLESEKPSAGRAVAAFSSARTTIEEGRR
jgi:hypothetical protein